MGVARLWDSNMADKAAAIDQATKLGGVVVHPPKVTGFDRPRRPPRGPDPHRTEHDGAHGSHLPGQPDEEF